MKPPANPSFSLLDKFLHLIESVSSSDRFILRFAFFSIIAFGIALIFFLNQQHSETTPTRGGSIVEGIIGTPRFVNPALTPTRADQDMTALIYSGLMKINGDGKLVTDIAEKIDLSEDGLNYTIKVRDNIKFHDGTTLTAHDVVYTLQLIQDPDLKSPLRGHWTDVAVELINDYELKITLEEAYAPFIENFTVGIMPAHIWSTLPTDQLPFSQLNTEPIGSGPFMVTDVKRDSSGLINHYQLSAFRSGHDNPKIDTLEIKFYQNETDLLTDFIEKEIDATVYLPPELVKEHLDDDYQLINTPLPRTFGIFFNQNRSSVLRDDAVRKALALAIDKDALIEKSLSGYGVPIISPVTNTQTEIESTDIIDSSTTTTPMEQATKTLEEGGWTTNNLGLWTKKIDSVEVILSITIRTSNTPLFESLITEISEQWKVIGVEVITEQFEQTGLVQSVIRPRDFEALLYGIDISRSYDLYPFWHSSQQDDPGLNISQYTNITVDDLLETARTQQSDADRSKALLEAQNIITAERPAIFLFQPTMTYLINKDVTLAEINQLGRPADRFSNISDWHTESDSLWPLFRNDM